MTVTGVLMLAAAVGAVVFLVGEFSLRVKL